MHYIKGPCLDLCSGRLIIYNSHSQMKFHLNNGLFVNTCTELHSRVLEELKQLSRSLIISRDVLALSILLTFL